MKNIAIEHQVNKAAGLLQAGRSEEAKKMLSEIFQTDKDNVDAWLLKAKLALNEGDRDSAADAYRHALRLKNDSEEAIVFLVNYHGVKGENDICEEILRNTIALHPEVARYHFMLGNLLLQKGLHSKAADQMKIAADLAPANLQVKVALAEIHGKHGNYDTAFDVIRPLLEMDPPHFPSVMIFAYICIPLNMIEECQLLLNKLSRTYLNPGQAEQLQNVRQMLIKSGIN